MKREPQQRVTQTAADEHDFHAESLESSDGFDGAGRDGVDVGA